MRLGLAISNGSSGIRIVVDFGLYTSNHIDPGPPDSGMSPESFVEVVAPG
jgi:hypothetical protein